MKKKRKMKMISTLPQPIAMTLEESEQLLNRTKPLNLKTKPPLIFLGCR